MPDTALILCDLNGVLYRYDRELRIARLAACTGQSAAAVLGAIWDSGFEDAGDAGALDADAYLHGFGRQLGAALSEADWLAAQQAAIAPVAASLAIVSRVRAGIGRAVLTNNNLLVRRHFDTLYPEIAACIGPHAYVSAEFHTRKPDPEVYRRCVAQFGALPADVLFVDDAAANVDAARQAGLQGYHYTGPEAFAAELQSRGLLASA